MMVKASKHVSVLLEETISGLNVKSGGIYLDCTLGGGGHSRRILEESSPDGQLVALDRDGEALVSADELLKDFPSRIKFHHLSYDRLNELEQTFDGIVFDLGLSSDQLEASGRGFSFSKTEPLDMRFDDRSGQTAAQFLNQANQVRIERVFKEYAEDRFSRRLTQKITESRRSAPIRTTTDFIRCVGTNDPKVLAPLFQALRIEVNDELQTLRRGLELATAALKPAGRLAVISFHSLEDRIVKEFMRDSLTVLTKKPIIPSEQEVAQNPRSRSAKLRVGVKP